MAIEFFRNDMMNKLFIPMVVTGTIALSAGVISATGWSPFSDPTSNIVTPNVDGDEENTDEGNTDGTDGGNTDGTDGGNTDGTDGGNTDGGNTDGTDGGNTDGTDGTDGSDTGSSFDDKAADYEIMGGLDYGGMTEEQLEYITSGITTVVRCASVTNYFVELGFNDKLEQWSYIISPEFGSNPVRLLSDYSYTNSQPPHPTYGFRWYKETYDYINTSGQIDWMNVAEADINFGNNNGTVEWSEWKEYMLDTHIKEFGYRNCDEFTYNTATTAKRSSLDLDISNYNLGNTANASNIYIDDFGNAKVSDLNGKNRQIA